MPKMKSDKILREVSEVDEFLVIVDDEVLVVAVDEIIPFGFAGDIVVILVVVVVVVIVVGSAVVV